MYDLISGILVSLTILTSALFIICVILLIKNRKWKYWLFTILSLVMVLSLLECIVWINTTINVLSFHRNHAFKNLKQMVNEQQIFYREHARYSESFKGLGYGLPEPGTNVIKGIGSRYSYYMANDCMNPGGMTEKWSDCFSSKMEDRHIYAAYSIKYFGRDVISIDFNGKIEIIESFDFWPLPIPE